MLRDGQIHLPLRGRRVVGLGIVEFSNLVASASGTLVKGWSSLNPKFMKAAGIRMEPPWCMSVDGRS